MEIQSPGRDASSSKNGHGKGTSRWRSGRADVRLSLGELGRKTFALPTCKTEKQAEERCALLATLADKLIAAGRVEKGLLLLVRAAERDGVALEQVVRAVDAVARGEVIRKSSPWPVLT